MIGKGMKEILLDYGVLKLLVECRHTSSPRYSVHLEGEGALLSTGDYTIAHDYFYMVAGPLINERRRT